MRPSQGQNGREQVLRQSRHGKDCGNFCKSPQTVREGSEALPQFTIAVTFYTKNVVFSANPESLTQTGGRVIVLAFCAVVSIILQDINHFTNQNKRLR